MKHFNTENQKEQKERKTKSIARSFHNHRKCERRPVMPYLARKAAPAAEAPAEIARQYA
jgi:hypothetical protein